MVDSCVCTDQQFTKVASYPLHQDALFQSYFGRDGLLVAYNNRICAGQLQHHKPCLQATIVLTLVMSSDIAQQREQAGLLMHIHNNRVQSTLGDNRN